MPVKSAKKPVRYNLLSRVLTLSSHGLNTTKHHPDTSMWFSQSSACSLNRTPSKTPKKCFSDLPTNGSPYPQKLSFQEQTAPEQIEPQVKPQATKPGQENIEPTNAVIPKETQTQSKQVSVSIDTTLARLLEIGTERQMLIAKLQALESEQQSLVLLLSQK